MLADDSKPEIDPPTSGRTFLAAKSLDDWLRVSLTGDAVVYHRGFLICDRDPQTSKLPVELQGVVHNVATELFERAQKGDLYLVQKRIGDGVYEYIAIRRLRGGRRRHR